ncbi:transketolase family protein [Candidatus Woesearchaeota archaeon]|nr:transketolase family protein [Candidatus Woesearchaeota archaeon]
MQPGQKTAAIRDGYGKGLLRIAEDNDVVVLDADLQDSTRSLQFGENHPERFFTMGISEADMVSTAAGLATCGKKPYASSFACFLVRNALDQIFVSVCYSKTNVKLVGSHAGLATGEDGPTAQEITDISVMRSLPNMKVIVPADSMQTEKAVEAMHKQEGPMYMRMSRMPTPIIYDDSHVFEIGKGYILREGENAAIIACGTMVSESLKAAEELEKEGIKATVINMSSIKPIDRELVIETANKTKAVVTAEDHTIIGGLGTAVEEVLFENRAYVPIEKIGVKDMFAESGKPEELYKKYGLSHDHIATAVKRVIYRKAQNNRG